MEEFFKKKIAEGEEEVKKTEKAMQKKKKYILWRKN